MPITDQWIFDAGVLPAAKIPPNPVAKGGAEKSAFETGNTEKSPFRNKRGIEGDFGSAHGEKIQHERPILSRSWKNNP